MRRTLIIILALSVCTLSFAQKKSDIVKTGINIGPLPAVAYDADKGLQIGAILQLFDYGDGSNYPNYDAKTYLEYSHYTKGSNLIQLRHDNKVLIPDVRWSTSLRINLDKAFDFYGLNGYQSVYNYDLVEQGKDKSSSFPIFTPFYKMKNNQFMLKSDFLGRITDNLQWEAGIFAYYFDIATIDYDNINKGKAEGKEFPSGVPTLFDIYKAAGVISETEADGGMASGLRAGLVYDTRDKEGAPSKGIWAEAHISAALPGISETPYYRYSATWRHYLPIIPNDVLTFAYRLNYEGNFGDSAPFYATPYLTVMGEKNDCDGMGGFFNVRGIMRNRVNGLDMATYNAELRWRFTKFTLWNQNIALGLNIFSDGTTVTRAYDLGKLETYAKTLGTISSLTGLNLQSGVVADRSDSFHITAGAGFRFIMNENFIVAADYGLPITHLMKNSPLYNQDGTGAFYINLGYLF